MKRSHGLATSRPAAPSTSTFLSALGALAALFLTAALDGGCSQSLVAPPAGTGGHHGIGGEDGIGGTGAGGLGIGGQGIGGHGTGGRIIFENIGGHGVGGLASS